MEILVDLHDVLADFKGHARSILKAEHPEVRIVPKEETPFYLQDAYSGHEREIVDTIVNSKGFLRNLPPIPGSIEALLYMEKKGHIVYICTVPMLTNPYCFSDTIGLVEYHLGPDWVPRLIFATDKTAVRGDFLIDDKPEIEGELEPTWTHVLYKQFYNAHITDKPRLTWDDYREVLGI